MGIRAVVVCAVALVLAGCGAQVDGAPEAVQSAGKPVTALQDLLLDATAFPPGAEKQELTSEQLQGATDDLAKTIENADVTPAQCVGQQQGLAQLLSDLFDDAVTAVYFGDDRLYAEVVIDRTVDLGPLAASTVGECASVRARVDVEGQSVDTTSEFTPLDVPEGLNADTAIAYRTHSTSIVGTSPPIERDELSGYAKIREMTVGVRVVSLGSGDPVDPQEFTKLFQAAVKKVGEAQ